MREKTVHVNSRGGITNIRHCPYCGELKLAVKGSDQRYFCSKAGEYAEYNDLMITSKFIKLLLDGKWKPAEVDNTIRY